MAAAEGGVDAGVVARVDQCVTIYCGAVRRRRKLLPTRAIHSSAILVDFAVVQEDLEVAGGKGVAVHDVDGFAAAGVARGGACDGVGDDGLGVLGLVEGGHHLEGYRVAVVEHGVAGLIHAQDPRAGNGAYRDRRGWTAGTLAPTPAWARSVA